MTQPAPTLPFEDLPPPAPVAHRPHTGARFWAQHPEAREAALELIQEGQSLSEVARQIGPMCDRTTAAAKDNGIRKHLQALIIIEKIDLIEIARLKSSMVRHEALDQMMEVIPEAGKRELGAIAMAANLAHQMERTLGGEASTIVEHRVTGLPTFEQLKNEARAQLPDTHTSTRDLDNVRVIDTTPQTQTQAP
jgi:hypothetical protein